MATIVLDATTKTVKAVMSAPATTNNPEFTAAWADAINASLTEGATTGSLNGTSAVDLVTAPAASTRRIIKWISLQNKDTAAVTVTIYYDNNGTTSQIAKVTLNPNDTWTTEGSFDLYGQMKTTGTTGPTGPTGPTGAASSVAGPTGPTGPVATNTPANNQTAAYILTGGDVGKYINITTGGVTVPNGVFSSGDVISIYNNSATNQTITQGTSVTMYQVGTANTGNRTLSQRGLVTVLCVQANTFVISGGGLS